jgi:hypothetical protein
MGIVSLFSDMTHEGDASILGDFLSLARSFGGGHRFCIRSRRADWLLPAAPHRWISIDEKILANDCFGLCDRLQWQFRRWLWSRAAAGYGVYPHRCAAHRKSHQEAREGYYFILRARPQTGAERASQYKEFLDQIGAFLGPVLLLFIMLLEKKVGISSPYTQFALQFSVFLPWSPLFYCW